MSRRLSGRPMDSIRRTFPAHIPLYLCAISSIATIAAVLHAYRITPEFEAGFTFLALFIFFVVAIAALTVMAETLRLVWDGFPDYPLQRMGKRLATGLCAEDRIGNIFHSVLALFPLLVGYTVFKNAITLIQPFGWDTTFSDLDRMIGFGRQPWEVLQPLLGHPLITTFLSYAYYVWFFILFACLAGQGFSRRSSLLRMQFLLAMALAFFVGGCVLAVFFSSAGPCYFAHLNLGASPYDQQLAYLRGIGPHPLPSVLVQDALWNDFADGALRRGVSAMPSMHVIIALIIGLFGWRKGGVFAPVLPAFAFVIALASVHLAWHYACDSIAGIVLGSLFWYAAGHIVEAWIGYLSRTAPQTATSYGSAAATGMEV